MGKASKWFRGLFGLKKSSSSTTDSSSSRPFSKEKRRWSFVKSYREKDNFTTHHGNDTQNFVVNHNDNDTTRSAANNQPHNADDHDKHAIAVAAATAAVAEAAVASAQAAAAVVRLTSGGGGGGVKKTTAYVSEEWASIKIQSAFRGCLVRFSLFFFNYLNIYIFYFNVNAGFVCLLTFVFTGIAKSVVRFTLWSSGQLTRVHYSSSFGCQRFRFP